MISILEFKLDLPNYILAVAFFLNIILAVVIFIGGKRNKGEVAFSVLALSASLWALGMFLYRGVLDDVSAINVTKFYYFFMGVAPSAFLYFSLNYPVKQSDFGSITRKLLFWFGAISIVSPLLSGFIVTSVVVQSAGENLISFGPGLFSWGFYLTLYFFLAFYFLFKKYRSESNNVKLKGQYKLIFIGGLISVVIGYVTNHLLPLFWNNPQYAWLGPVAALFMTSSIAMAIYKYNFLDRKLIITELLIFFVWVALLINLLLSQSAVTFVPNIFILLAVIVLGIFVIRSVMREVKQKEALAIANAGQENLIHIITHQIKGYLSKSRQIFSELIIEPEYGPMPDKAKPLLKVGFDSLTEGVEFTQQLLNASSVEKGTLVYSINPMNMKTLVEEVANMQKENLEKHKLGFSLNVDEGDYNIAGDYLQLKEVIRNLLDNSIHYTPSGRIDMRLSHKDGKVLVSIKDTGVGLTEADKTHLFKKGSRGDESLKINVNSTGYGLFFVKGVIDGHNGKVWAESEGRDKGSTFFVELPVKGPGDLNQPSYSKI